MDQDSSSLAALADLLRRTACRIHELEESAFTVLNQQNDRQNYTRLLVKKCELLRELPQQAASLPMPSSPQNTACLAELHDMAERAALALRLESPFFMVNLLYADDHQTGQPNQLDRLAGRISHASRRHGLSSV